MGGAVASVAGAIAGAALAGPLGIGLLNAGIGLTAGQGILAGKIGGFLVSTAINQIGSRVFAKKPKAPSFSQDAGGRTVSIRSSVETHKIIYGTARISGPLIHAVTTNGLNSNGNTGAKANRYLHLIFALAGHEVEEVGDVYFNDQIVTLDGGGNVTSEPYYKSSVSYALVRKFTGANDQAADSLLIQDIPDWTTNHRNRGVAYLYVRLDYNPDVFPTGIPNVSAIVKGRKVYDPRDGGQDPDDASTWLWTDNAALCIRDYLTADFGFGCLADEIDDSFFIAAANISEENVTLLDGSTQDRYTANGVVDTGAAPLENLGQMLTSCGGIVTYSAGKFRLHAAAYDSPTVEITETMLAGDYSIDQIHTPRKELFNAVRGTYVDPNKSWQPPDFPPLTNSTYEAQDGGEQIFRDFEFPFTTHPEAAQRLAKIALEKGRQGIVVTLPLKHHGIELAVMDVVTVTLADEGWSSKPFRVLQWSLSNEGPVQVTLQEESSASYDWNSGEATEIDPAPNTNLPSFLTVQPPVGLEVTEDTYITRTGDGVKALAELTWVASPDAFFKEYQAEYKPSTGSEWTILPRTTTTTLTVEDITPGTYDFRVKALNVRGVSSAYATTSAQISGLLAPPTEPQNLTISTIGGLAVLRWDISPDVDVRIGGKYVFRHSPDAGDGWTQSTSIGNAVSGHSTVAVLPLKPGIYLAKAVDSSGIESALASSAPTAQATALEYANVDSLTEHPAFSGSKTDCIASSGILKLGAAGLVDDIPDVDSVSDWDSYGGSATSGVYLFSGGIDLASQMRVRITSHLRASIVNSLDLIDDREENIDEWLDFDGDSGLAAVADAIVYVRATNDNPSGSPTWSAWQRLDSGEYYNRAFEFKLEMSTDDAAYNIEVSELSVTIDEVV